VLPPKPGEDSTPLPKRAKTEDEAKITPIPSFTESFPGITNHSEQYVVLGHLILPRPPPELKERAELWEQSLRQLDARDIGGKSVWPLSDLAVL